MKIRFFLKDAIQPRILLNKKGDAVGVKYDKSADKVEIEEKVSDNPSHVSMEELHEVLGNLSLRSNK